MSFPNASRFILAAIGGILLSGWAPLRAQDAQPADPQDAPPAEAPAPVETPFAVSIQKGESIGFEQIFRVKITTSTNEFAFVVPRGLNLRVDASFPGKIIISKADSTYFMTLRFIQGQAQSSGGAESNSMFRNIVMNQYEGASGLEESSMSADGQSGPAFDANWYIGGTSTRRTVRVAFIPTVAGVLECSMVADPKKSSEAKSALSAMLLTLRSNKNGKLENLVLMDKS